MKKLIPLIFILILSSKIFSQVTDLSRERNFFYQDEKTYGLKISSNGWGLDFRRGYFINAKHKNIYEIGFNTIKHPKEYKFQSYYYLTKTFVYGKLNECYDIKAGFGKQFVLFDKKEPGTVQIRLFYTLGTDLAFLKPIYYTIIINNNLQTIDEKYKPSHQPALITKKAPFFEGLNETTIDPGIYFKLGTSFEHSKNVKSVRSLELGIETYAFLKNLEIMAETDNPRVIVSLFISYRMGKLMKNKHKVKKDY